MKGCAIPLLAVLLSLTFSPSAFSDIHLTAILTGDEETPATGAPGKGGGVFTLDDSKTELNFILGVSGLTGPIVAAHFHNAQSGRNGPPVKNLSPDFTASSAGGFVAIGSWKSTDSPPLTPSLVAQFLAGQIYVNIHTDANGAGEIRGQLKVGRAIDFSAALSGSQEAPQPPVPTNATGTGSFSLNADGTELTFGVTVSDLSGPIVAAHFHRAARGAPGPVVRNITLSFTGNTATGSWKSTDAPPLTPLTPALLAELLAGNIYVNVHTQANGGGEIRGQVDIAGKAPAAEAHDLAVTKLKVPKKITLSEKRPSVTKPVVVEIQNRSPGDETISDINELKELVSLIVSSVDDSAGAPTAILRGTKKRLPITLKSKKKLQVIFDVTFDHAVDPGKSSKKDAGHDDFKYTASVDLFALDEVEDTSPDDDTCPRSADASSEEGPSSGSIKDKGCGSKKADKTLGGDVVTDVVQK